ncbi:MAG: methyltransferase domain-containing protein [Patescibacteria group bacterium]
MTISDVQIIDRLKIKPTDRVLDVGGSAKQHNEIQVDTILDLVRPEKTPYQSSKLKAKNFVQVDIARQKFPFQDKEFDVCLCTHTLEDIYNPFLAIDEMSRVAKRGLIATPSRGREMEFSHFNLTDWQTGPRRLPGFSHHFWLFENRGEAMSIVPKNYPLLYSGDFHITKWTGDEEFRFFWQNKIKYKVFNPTNFHELIKEYQRFLSENKQFIKKGPVLFYFDNPLYYFKEIIKTLIWNSCPNYSK